MQAETPSGESPGASGIEMVAASRAGDAEAFRYLMTRYMPLVTAYLYGKVRERDDALDISQEVFLKVYSALPALKDSRRFAPWLMMITKNKLRDYYRNQSRRLPAGAPSPHLDENARSSDRGPEDEAPSPAQKAGEKELIALVSASIGQLPDKYRVITYLRLLEERGTGEIAELLDLKESTVRTRLGRALRTLRKELQKLGFHSP